MFKLRIMSAKLAISESKEATKIVSLVSPDGRFAKLDFGSKQHREKFDDFDMPTNLYPDAVLPRLDHIQRVLAFANKFDDDDDVIVHCHAGRCRSSAMAIGILVQAGLSPDEAVEYVFRIRPRSVPNTLVLEHCETALGLNNSELRDLVEDWYKANGLPWQWSDEKLLATEDENPYLY